MLRGVANTVSSAPSGHTTPGGPLSSVLYLIAPLAHLPCEGRSLSYSTQRYHDGYLGSTQAPLSSLVADTHPTAQKGQPRHSCKLAKFIFCAFFSVYTFSFKFSHQLASSGFLVLTAPLSRIKFSGCHQKSVN